MTENLTTIKKLTGTRVIKGKRLPHSVGKIRDVVFFPDKKCVAGFVTKQSDFLLLIRRKGRFVSINGYYMYEDLAFIRQEKGTSGKAAYKSLGLDPDVCVLWLGLPIITEDGRSVGVVSDVVFVHQSGEVQSVIASQGTIGKLLQGTRTIPTDLIRGYCAEVTTALAHTDSAHSDTTHTDQGAESENAAPQRAILVSNEALAIEIDSDKTLVSKAGKQVSAIASKAGVDTTAVSEKAKSAVEVAGALASDGAAATSKQLKKTKGMFSAFKDEFDKALHDD